MFYSFTVFYRVPRPGAVRDAVGAVPCWFGGGKKSCPALPSGKLDRGREGERREGSGEAHSLHRVLSC